LSILLLPVWTRWEQPTLAQVQKLNPALGLAHPTGRRASGTFVFWSTGPCLANVSSGARSVEHPRKLLQERKNINSRADPASPGYDLPVNSSTASDQQQQQQHHAAAERTPRKRRRNGGK
ncbi:unnamed protein product, partial [Lampetra planeri]